MKRTIQILLLFTLALGSCKKNPVENMNDTGCIERVDIPSSAVLLSAADQAAALSLFQQNNITKGSLQFYRYDVDNNNYGNMPGPYQYVWANQYFNNLQLFNGTVTFAFRQGVALSYNGTMFTGINLDTVPHLSLIDVRAVFLNAANSAALKNACLNAQFGYFDLSNGSGSPSPNFVKAWKVTIKNQTYPILYLRDDNSAVISFNDISVAYAVL